LGKRGDTDRIPPRGNHAQTQRMTKGTRTQRLPARLPFKTDGPTTGAHREYQTPLAIVATKPDSELSGLGDHQSERAYNQSRCQGLCTPPAKNSRMPGQ